MHTRLTSVVLIASLMGPMVATAQDVAVPYERDFILTAYYSPLPDQCCYVKGSLEADKILNGNGTHGADGTAVYPGMLAAPKSYGFGTRIVLPGLGTMTVHDRGGAIQQMLNADRLDVWAGSGEEGLARALAFGVQHIRGTVYPVGTSQPPEQIDLARLPAPVAQLKPFLIAEAGLLSMHPVYGEKGPSVTLLQQYLHDAGYMREPTGFFGEETKNALLSFNADYGIEGNGTSLTMEQAAYLTAAGTMKQEKEPVSFIDNTSSVSDIQAAQRLLRYLGFYRGRTNGVYSEALFNAIVSYQQSQLLVGDASSPGAGRIGPKTQGRLTDAWRKRIIAQRAEKALALKRVADTLSQRGSLLTSFLSSGQNGASVRAMQTFLAHRGFFPEKLINGNFGGITEESVKQYQMARGLIPDASDPGAGTVGPKTLADMRDEQILDTYRLVRAQGWDAL